VTSVDVSADLRELKATLTSVEAVLDLPALRRELAELEAAAADPGLWDDTVQAQKITSRLSYIQAELKKLASLHERMDDVAIMFELADDESDPGAAAEAATELDSIRKAVDELEVRTLLSGEYDERDCVLTVRSGAGGADACDFAEQLMRIPALVRSPQLRH
jgi:peptide chain release factor 2